MMVDVKVQIMRKFVSKLLILTILVANLAWAVDTHAEAYFGHDSEWAQDLSPEPENPGIDDVCDHCCHGLAHIIGLTGNTDIVLPIIVDSTLELATHHYRTRSQSPPIPPPNA